MPQKHTVVFALFVTAFGCSEATNTPYSSPTADDGAAITTPDDDDVPVMQSTIDSPAWEGCPSQAEEAMYAATDASIHELVTCGGMQIELARSMVGILLASNETMYDEQTLQDLEAADDVLPRNPFERVDRQNWEVQMGPGSTFAMKFIDPTTGEAISEDPFDLESYLVGLRATYQLTFEEMMNQPERKNRWEFTWDEPGPLVHLMNGGEPVPDTFVLELSLYELVDIVYFGGEPFLGTEQADMGPFDSILDVEMKSQVVLEDTRRVSAGDGAGDAVVRYDVGIRRQSVRNINAGSGLQFDLRRMTTTLDGREMVATKSDLRYGSGGVGLLVGEIAFATPSGGSVVADFGDGASYPEDVWTCTRR